MRSDAADKELEARRTEAWREFANDVRSTGRRLRKAGTRYARAHPLLLLGGGALLGALVVSRIRRRPRVEPRPTLKQRLLHVGAAWLARALSEAWMMAEDERREWDIRSRDGE